jgi:hypothetical protein
MTEPSGSHGEFFFADSGYFVEALRQSPALAATLRQLFRRTAGKRSAALAQRLMYGSDWEMIVNEGRETREYLSSFHRMFAEFDRDPTLGAEGILSDRFFGMNAANFLGLRSTGRPGTRSRLEKFYRKHGVPTPLWMKKIDRTDPEIAGRLPQRRRM